MIPQAYFSHCALTATHFFVGLVGVIDGQTLIYAQSLVIGHQRSWRIALLSSICLKRDRKVVASSPNIRLC